ncbi:Putative Short chain dehydrogenase reductase family [[Torrubiella] hemipterigena]|uniref:Putative Short chain dehydrogenase reductase family n=1 Tax=[Torrubiella] hemipterigena TaxID=1531966 RepID=A0A0A1TLW9_9HYPO|nr:Putative Short chain dehydrogenase reductase family [[Torrubiella] hemipterigena]
MTTLTIDFDVIPNLAGKRVIITGASSGIGLAAATIFQQKGAWVLNLDTNPPLEGTAAGIEYRKCDVSNWKSLKEAFAYAGTVDIAVSNAGISETTDFVAEAFDGDFETLQELEYRVLDVNLRAVINFTRLALNHFHNRKYPGSIVITSSATAYAPEQSLPVYSASKLALIGFIRALRSSIRLQGITINAVAPAATITNLLPPHLAAPIIAAGLPISTAEFVGLALVYSATANQSGIVELYGKDAPELLTAESRWHGQTILTLGHKYTELDGPIASLRPQWFGDENTTLTGLQQASTDFRTGAALL